MKIVNYIKEIGLGLWHLFQGMYITMLNMLRPKITEQYPENRGKHVYPAAFRAQLTMPYNQANQHKCTACGICQMNCPNGTIQVISKVDEDTGKKVLDKHLYDLGSCTFCALCTQTCPQNAIEWSNNFEHSVFTRDVLVQQLNKPGSTLLPKPAPAPKPAATEAPAKPATEAPAAVAKDNVTEEK